METTNIQSGIYKITNTINHRVYFGSTYDFKLRFYKHKTSLNNRTHHNIFLENDWHKCGEKFFIFEPILTIKNIETMLDVEQYFIDLFWDNCINCYNISKDSRAPHKGTKFSLEHKINLSNSHKGKKLSETHKNNISKANKGKNMGDKNGIKKGIKNPLFGKPKSADHRKKISDSKSGSNHENYGKPRATETKNKIGKANGTPIISINILTKEITEFYSLSEAGRFYECSMNTIKKHLENKKILKNMFVTFEYKN